MKVKDIMVKDVVTLSPDDTFYDIVDLFAEKKISGAPVVEKGNVLGLVSESDIMKFVESKDIMTMIEKEDKLLKEKASLKAKEFMTKGVISVASNDELSTVIKLIDEKDINRVPVVDKGKIVGIITRADIVSVVSDYLTDNPSMRKMAFENEEEPKLETNIDKLMMLVKMKGTLTLSDAAKEFNVEKDRIEKWAGILEDYKMAKLKYPPFGDPKIVMIKEKKHGRKE